MDKEEGRMDEKERRMVGKKKEKGLEYVRIPEEYSRWRSMGKTVKNG